MPEFFNEYGGTVLSTTFDKYCYVNVRHLPRFFDYSSEIVYSQIERVSSVSEIVHPAVREAMKLLDMHELRVNYEADLPARTGLGTSSSFAVGMLNAFHSLKGSFVSKRQLAEEAIHLERTLCAEAGGWQDQIAASYGGLNKISFEHGRFEISPIIMKPERKRQLEDRLMLFFTGFVRFSSEVQESMRYSDKTSELLHMKELAGEAERVLVNKHADIDEFGRLLDESWNLKRGLGSRVSTDEIDELYNRAVKAGALGGKLLGAGGGGFLLLYAPQDFQASICEALDGLLRIPFRFEEGGTRVVHYAPEEFEAV